MVQVLNDGTVAVSYYDFRNNTADSGATTPTDAFVVHCHADCADRASWGEETRVTDASFDSRKAPVARGSSSATTRDSAPTEPPCSHFSP